MRRRYIFESHIFTAPESFANNHSLMQIWMLSWDIVWYFAAAVQK